MSQETNQPQQPSDDDLLANAIPIDAEELQAQESQPVEEAAPIIELEESAGDLHREIKAFGKREATHIEDKWRRKVNVTGHGAVHCKTFVSKLRLDALEYMDTQINQWLDEHPDYEVKLVTTSVGILTGKLREEALFVNVWV